MAMDSISHEGRVVNVNPQTTTVEFISSSACSSCRAAGLCGMSEVEKKAVRVPTDPYKTLVPGQVVDVQLKQSMGLKAVWLCYGVPLIILMIIVLSLSAVGMGELAVGLISVAGIGIYYFVIWLLRSRIAKDYVFVVKEKESNTN